jgi:WD40-like Beta Propeller Repeat
MGRTKRLSLVALAIALMPVIAAARPNRADSAPTFSMASFQRLEQSYSRDGTKGLRNNTVVNLADGTVTPIPAPYSARKLDGTGRHVAMMSFVDRVLLVWDSVTGVVTAASTPSLGPVYANESDVAFSSDGSAIAYVVPRTSTTGRRGLVVGPVGGQALEVTNGLPNNSPTFASPGSIGMSVDGRYTSFAWFDTNFVCGAASPSCNVSIHRFDRMTGRTEQVDVNPDGTIGVAVAGSPAMSADGRFIAFVSDSPSLVGGLVGRRGRVFLRDMVREQTWLLAETSLPATQVDSVLISGDGRRVVWREDVRVNAQSVSTSHLVDLADGSVTTFPFTANPSPSSTSGLRPTFIDAQGTMVLLDGLRLYPAVGSENATRVTLSAPTGSATTITIPKVGTVDLTVVPTATPAMKTTSLTLIPTWSGLRFSRDGSAALDLIDGIRNLVTGKSTPLVGGYRYVNLDASGSQAAVLNDSDELFRLDVSSGATARVPFPVPTAGDLDIGTIYTDFGPDASVVMDTSGSVFAYTTYSASNTRGRGYVTAIDGTPIQFTKSLPNLGGAGMGGMHISADGRYVVFTWSPGCLYSATPCSLNIYRYDRLTSEIARVDINADGTATSIDSRSPSMSDDGRFVAFISSSPTFIGGQTTAKPRIYLRDLVTKRTHLIVETALPFAVQAELSLSGDARRLFYHDVSTLPSPIGPLEMDVLRLADFADGTITQVASSSGGLPYGSATIPFMNQAGSVVVFQSNAINLISPPPALLFPWFRATLPLVASTSSLRLPSGATIALDGSGGAAVPFHPQQPERLLDTRSGGPVNYIGTKPVAGAVVEVPLPAGAASAVLNVTGLDAADAGFVTVYPCGEQRPNASNLNLVPDVVSPNLVISKVGANGKVCIYTEKAANIFADIAGTFGADSALSARSPERVLDTRSGGPVNYVGAKPAAGAVVEVPVPPGAAAAVLNVTGLDASDAGFVTVFPCGEQRPNASNLNLVPDVVSPNLVISKVGANGKVCIYTEKSANLFADLSGTLTSAGYAALTPVRIADTRAGGPVNYSGPKPAAGAVVEVSVPSGIGAAVLNVTGLDASDAGFVTVYPCGESRPNASNLNLVPDVVSPNLVIAKPGSNGKVCIFTEKSANLFVDLAGTFPV